MAQDMPGKAGKATPPTFQDVIMNLQRYWASTGCVVLQPYDNEVGAGTNAPATTLRSLGPDTWRTCYVQGCRRPTDGRYGENPNRGQFYYQFQVLIKPSPDNIQDLYLGSLEAIGIDGCEDLVFFCSGHDQTDEERVAMLRWTVEEPLVEKLLARGVSK